MMQFHANLNARRKELGYTYEEVHALLEKRQWSPKVKPPSLATVGHWFNGTRRPRNMEHLRGLCDVLGMQIDEAVKGSPEQAATGVEQALLNSVRRLSDADAEMLLAMAHRMEKMK